MTILFLVSIVSWRTKTVNKIVITFVKYLILMQLTAAVLMTIFFFTVLRYLRKMIHVGKQYEKDKDGNFEIKR